MKPRAGDFVAAGMAIAVILLIIFLLPHPGSAGPSQVPSQLPMPTFNAAP